MNIRKLLAPATLLAICFQFAALDASAQQTSVSATLIFASSQGESIDPALKAYEGNLKRLFKYNSYRLQGRSNANLSIPGKSTISLGTGHRVELNAQPSDGSKVRLSVKWSDSRRMLLNTTFNQGRGKPLILGGPSAPSQNGNLILVLLPK